MSFRYKFIFSSENDHIVEIKVLGLPDDVPKSKKYHWLRITDNDVEKLNFVSMSENSRVFQQGELTFKNRIKEHRLNGLNGECYTNERIAQYKTSTEIKEYVQVEEQPFGIKEKIKQFLLEQN